MTATIVPYNDQIGNAIRNVLFIFTFGTPLPVSAVMELSKGSIHDDLKALLPKVAQQKSQKMTIVEGKSLATEEKLVGCKFERFNERGEISLGLSVEPSKISIVCGEYTRWEAVRTSISEVLQKLSAWLITHEVRTSAFTLQYLDEFRVYFAENDKRTLVDLFALDSPYLVRNFSELEHEFHSHHGFFTQPDFGIQGRLLNNVNIGVNCSPDRESSIVQIQTIHRYDASAVLEIVSQDGDLSPLLVGAYEYMHQENKKVMRTLLTEQAQQIIKLDSGRTV
ncbi:TIGR04255 family protein [Pseudomonas fulva]|uniref:TIGR04255 family protein n=1 Tax=Pseudomonas fulva TaxID=47880 RepID=UPI00244A1255|nr:TIGR04255 family protein [Pseudomonas fulva]MDH0619159.1 TIGR04255 family protein [Pseudomonas fulva]